MPRLMPCLLERSIQTRIWGGKTLRRLFGIQAPADSPIGETWELFDRPEGSSPIVGGGTLREWMAADAMALLGRGVAPGHGGRFPLLCKFLDAQEALSVQVHPDDAQARASGDGGKSEAWLVLHAAPEARIIRGFRPGVTREQVVAAARTPAIAALLYSFRPAVDDCIDVPAGTVHAVGPGTVVFEVQQNSDITWRIYDWGRNRETHVAQALAVARIEDGSQQPTVPPRPLPDGGVQLVRTPFFRLRRYRLGAKLTLPTGGAFMVLTVLGGNGVLGWQSGGADLPLRLLPGACVLVPGSTESVFVSPIGSLDLVVTDPARAG